MVKMGFAVSDTGRSVILSIDVFSSFLPKFPLFGPWSTMNSAVVRISPVVEVDFLIVYIV
jgi:hypothetical protein